MDLNRNLPRIDPSRFAMVPRADIPRSTFVTTHSHKTTAQNGYLIPIHVDEVLPGDVHQGSLTIFARLSTLLFPLMDNVTIETFFFFCPARLVWVNWKKMMGERNNPADSISYTVPQVQSPSGGWAINSIYDYFGIPVAGQIPAGSVLGVNALPLRAYNLIWNDWFRDQNLQNALTVDTDDGPDTESQYAIRLRNKKHDYFTSALPWPLKGGTEVTMPLSGSAPVKGIAVATNPTTTAGSPTAKEATNLFASGWGNYLDFANSGGNAFIRMENDGGGGKYPYIFADLSNAVGATINALRLAVQTQRLLERDARSGTRYTELLRAHFGVTPEDQRLQRPEYIGGGRTYLQTSAIPQTSATGLTGGSSPLGALGATATAADQHTYSYHATEHGYIIGLLHFTGDKTYQQGLHRMWTRQTRYDFYWPAFAHLGEQAIRNDEIYCRGNINTDDQGTFGYQERWAEYRHRPSRISGLFRSTSTGNIDEWHLAEQFGSLPALNSTFIQDNTPFSRVLAAGGSADYMQLLFDSVFKIKTTRPMPMFSVPGQLDRF